MDRRRETVRVPRCLHHRIRVGRNDRPRRGAAAHVRWRAIVTAIAASVDSYRQRTGHDMLVKRILGRTSLTGGSRESTRQPGFTCSRTTTLKNQITMIRGQFRSRFGPNGVQTCEKLPFPDGADRREYGRAQEPCTRIWTDSGSVLDLLDRFWTCAGLPVDPSCVACPPSAVRLPVPPTPGRRETGTARSSGTQARITLTRGNEQRSPRQASNRADRTTRGRTTVEEVHEQQGRQRDSDVADREVRQTEEATRGRRMKRTGPGSRRGDH